MVARKQSPRPPEPCGAKRGEEKGRQGGNVAMPKSSKAKGAGMKLRCLHGQYRMAAFTVERARDGAGFWAWVACDATDPDGGHWLAPDAQSGRLVVRGDPYPYADITAALAAKERFEQQDSERFDE